MKCKKSFLQVKFGDHDCYKYDKMTKSFGKKNTVEMHALTYF